MSLGKDCPRGSDPGVEHTPGKVSSWRIATATRGRSVLFLHYRDQALNAGDDDPVSGKSAHASAISSFVGVTFAVKVRWVVARRALTPREF